MELDFDALDGIAFSDKSLFYLLYNAYSHVCPLLSCRDELLSLSHRIVCGSFGDMTDQSSIHPSSVCVCGDTRQLQEVRQVYQDEVRNRPSNSSRVEPLNRTNRRPSALMSKTNSVRSLGDKV